MNSRAKYLLKNTSLFALSEIATKVINFILVPFYTYVLTKAEYGTADLVFTIGSLFVPLVMFNIGEAIMRFLLDKGSDDNKIRSIEFCIILFGACISLVFIPASKFIPRMEDYGIYIYMYIVFCAFQQVSIAYVRGKEKLLLYAICNIINTLLVAGFNILFLLSFHLGIKGYLLAYIIAYAISGIFAFFSGGQFKSFKFSKIDKQLAKSMILFSLAVIPNSMMWWIINSSDKLMVSYMKSADENGLLTVAYKIPSLLTTFSFILMQAWKYSAISEKDSKDKEEFNNKILYLFFRSMIIISAVLLVFNDLVTKIYSNDYYESRFASSFLLFGNVFLATATFFGTSYYVEKKMVGNLISAVIGAIVNVVFNFILIPHFGAAGATMAAAICYIIIMVYRYFDTQKFLKLKFWTVSNVLNMIILLLILINANLRYKLNHAVAFSALLMLVIINIGYIKTIFHYGLGIVRKRNG